ncbi:MAG: YibE/F family protein [Lachnospiraceae bacterium]|nr:YibE/F family protein [Lachnospiraceae bacterium]
MADNSGSKNGKNKAVVWFAVVILSIIALWVGNTIVTKDFQLFSDSGGMNVRGKVVEIIDDSSQEQSFGGTETFTSHTITFSCKIENGVHAGEIFTAEQALDDIYASSNFLKEVEVGDDVMLYNGDSLVVSSSVWNFVDYYRFNKIVVLGLVFAALILIIGRGKGVNTLLSLCLTFLFIFFVFVPSVMNGYNVYIWVSITCIYTIVMTLMLVSGASRKTLATIIGCMSGTVFSAITTSTMSNILNLTGFVDEHSIYLSMLNPDKPIDLTAIIFAAITIGAMGAIMDVAMDIASSLWEICQHVPNITFKKLFKSGMRIGRDIMGTMANTLVLAYIGSSMASFMLLITYSSSMMHLLNREIIITELLQALTGSLAILLTIPLTVIVCGFIYLKKENYIAPKKSTPEMCYWEKSK